MIWRTTSSPRLLLVVARDPVLHGGAQQRCSWRWRSRCRMLLGMIVIWALTGMTLNMVVLFSLILALGMLVDNAIVLVENIYRHVEEGDPISSPRPSRARKEVVHRGDRPPPLTTVGAFASAGAVDGDHGSVHGLPAQDGDHRFGQRRWWSRCGILPVASRRGLMKKTSQEDRRRASSGAQGARARSCAPTAPFLEALDSSSLHLGRARLYR